MTTKGSGPGAYARAQATRPGLLLFTYGSAIFLSAGLLFAIQPMFAKIVLPQLGGSPSVWSVAMVFFQASLLAGYLYAHLLTQYLPGRPSVIVHVVVMLAATLALPVAIASGWGRPPAVGEAFWLLGLFAVSIGLPFFALAANAPLLQAWFARTGHPSAHDPYFLYAASNVGSFLALLSYPLLVEPVTRLGQQTQAWSLLFYLLIALIVVCGWLLVRSRNALPPVDKGTAKGKAVPGRGGAAPGWRDAARWVVLAAVPSAFLIAVTAHITTDIAAVPLMWVVPLALYLLSFVIVFQTDRIVPHEWFIRLQPGVVALLIGSFVFTELQDIFVVIAINLAAFFVIAMVCHGELARLRPAARHLTVFYLWLAAGGVTGGIFAGLIAPHLFNWVVEYPLLIVAGILCRPDLILPRGMPARLTLAAAAILAVLAFLFMQYPEFRPQWTAFNGLIGVMLLTAAIFLSRDALRLAGVFAFALVLIHAHLAEGSNIKTVRSFFGVHKVYDSPAGDVRVLMHGTTIHGAQSIGPTAERTADGRPQPITYFAPQSGMAHAFEAVKQNKKGPARIAVVGLGAGTVACFTRPEDTLHFYEIDQSVVRIALDPTLFTFVSDCKPDARIILGDARLTLDDAPDGHYDLIVMDAFTSDAVPVHLLTREAMALYLRKLAPGGMVIAHVMNRHMELASVVAGVADANGLVTRVMHAFEHYDPARYIFGSSVAAVARSDEDFGALLESGQWLRQETDPRQWVWTDDYSNIVGAMIRHMHW